MKKYKTYLVLIWLFTTIVNIKAQDTLQIIKIPPQKPLKYELLDFQKCKIRDEWKPFSQECVKHYENEMVITSSNNFDHTSKLEYVKSKNNSVYISPFTEMFYCGNLIYGVDRDLYGYKYYIDTVNNKLLIINESNILKETVALEQGSQFNHFKGTYVEGNRTIQILVKMKYSPQCIKIFVDSERISLNETNLNVRISRGKPNHEYRLSVVLIPKWEDEFAILETDDRGIGIIDLKYAFSLKTPKFCELPEIYKTFKGMAIIHDADPEIYTASLIGETLAKPKEFPIGFFYREGDCD